ncbi:MAG: RNA-binding protein [Planctomycetes bacterium]|nr:RNA-binding protein [Planctomycetota bacterium]
MKLYVGNLPFNTTEDEIRELFSQKGAVKTAQIVMDRETGRSRGFGFVEMNDATAGKAVIEGLNGFSFSGRALVVNEARPKAEGGRTGGGSSRGGW